MEEVIDFTKGSAWGRAIHGSTFSKERAGNLLDRFRDWREGAVRASVMCHYPRPPRKGEILAWRSQDGVVRAPIYDVKPCRDPDDMFTVFVRITDNCRGHADERKKDARQQTV